MLVGHVSDERYVAIADAYVEFEQAGRSVAVVRSTPRGAIYADIAPGNYRVTLVKDGFGSKSVEVHADPEKPYAFRLLSDCLLGYVWPKWVKSGERSEFRVHAVEPYRLSLWRYGWKKEFIRLLGWFDEHGPRAVMQITPDGDYTQTGIQWNKQGYGSPHHTQFVTGPEKGGLYYLHAQTVSGGFFAFPWIVAPAKPQAPIAVLASTNNWNAYNRFGGRSNYVNSDGLPPTPIVNARLELPRYSRIATYPEWTSPDQAYPPLSFERPEPANSMPEDARVTDPIVGRDASHQAPAEWRFLGWLERERFVYDLYSEYQLHAGEIDLDAYKVLVLTVHPEYWSKTMYLRVKDWVRHRGGKLMYLGGNGLNCEVELNEDFTMRCKTHVDKNEGRFARTVESEANLLGVEYTDPGIMTAAPYRVVDASHWVFARTNLKNGNLFGEKNLQERCNGGASGHETDKRNQHSPSGTVLLAKGTNPEDGGAEMVYYELSSGGAVYSVGSITYVASLLVDDDVSQITRTVLERFIEGK